METPADWPFPDDSPNVAVITTQAVLDGEWIALATIDEEDGGWHSIAAASLSKRMRGLWR